MGRQFHILIVLCSSILASACSHNIRPEVAAIYSGPIESVAEQRCLQRRGNIESVPEKQFTTDGCSMWFDADWQHCCVDHDMEYWCGGTAAERKNADRQLRDCIRGTNHPVNAAVMFLGTRLGGSRVCPMPWRWGYGWPWLSDMTRDSR